jgi:hypothetical protein
VGLEQLMCIVIISLHCWTLNGQTTYPGAILKSCFHQKKKNVLGNCDPNCEIVDHGTPWKLVEGDIIVGLQNQYCCRTFFGGNQLHCVILMYPYLPL